MKKPLWPWLGLSAAVALFFRSRSAAAGVSDAFSPYEPATRCDPTPKPGVLAFRDYWRARHGERPGSPQNITRDCGIGSLSEHHDGRAWDWMLPQGVEHAEAAVEELTANDGALARQVGLMYMILNRRMWRSYPFAGAKPGTWGTYGGPNPHTDHVHFSFGTKGAMAQTSFHTSA